MSSKVALRCKAVMSVPRLGFNDHFGAAFEALGKFGMMPSWYTTAFWEKGIETAFEDCLFGFVQNHEDRPKWDPTRELKCDLIIALDYDTLCTAEHVRTLIHTMAERPDIDALASLQPRRGTGTPLCCITGQTGDTETCGPLKVDSAAFGLTAIRASSLLKLSKPWFIATPSADHPQNRADYLDPDMYFWSKWKREGFTAYVEPSLNIGHLEGMVSMFEQVEEPSLNEQIDQAEANLRALKGEAFGRGETELNEKRVVMKQTFIRASEWRKKHGRPESGRSLGESEER